MSEITSYQPLPRPHIEAKAFSHISHIFAHFRTFFTLRHAKLCHVHEERAFLSHFQGTATRRAMPCRILCRAGICHLLSLWRSMPQSICETKLVQLTEGATIRHVADDVLALLSFFISQFLRPLINICQVFWRYDFAETGALFPLHSLFCVEWLSLRLLKLSTQEKKDLLFQCL